MIVNISGRAGAGKDQFATYLWDALKNGYKQNAVCDRYAAPIKAASAIAFKDVLTPLALEGRDYKEKAVEVEAVDILKGVDHCLDLLDLNVRLTRVAEVFGPYLDLDKKKVVISPRVFEQHLGTAIVRSEDPDAFVERIVGQNALDPEAIIIVPDCRFLNEVDASKAWVFISNSRVGDVAAHPSEQLAVEIETRLAEAKHSTVYAKVGPRTWAGRDFRLVRNEAGLDNLKHQANAVADAIIHKEGVFRD